MLRKIIRDQSIFPGQSNSDDREIKNDGQRDLKAEEANCKNVKSILENLTLTRDSQQNLQKHP